MTAYPVEPVRWQGTSYSRLDTATTLFAELAEPITEAILAAGRDVVRATAAVNGMLGMDNDFPIFMAVMDLAWFRPDLVDPASDVPTGIGAAAYMDRLQAHLGARDHHETARRMVALAADRWPDARRPLQPIDIEFLCCECRKYWSYVNGTKSFTGKNVFVPGESARLLFDLDRDPPTATVQTGVCVLAGGPGAGKTTLLRALERAGHEVLAETAEVRLRQAVEAGGKAEDVRADPVAWQRAILHADLELFDGLAADGVVFTDTSVIEDVVFARRACRHGCSAGGTRRCSSWSRWPHTSAPTCGWRADAWPSGSARRSKPATASSATSPSSSRRGPSPSVSTPCCGSFETGGAAALTTPAC